MSVKFQIAVCFLKFFLTAFVPGLGSDRGPLGLACPISVGSLQQSGKIDSRITSQLDV